VKNGLELQDFAPYQLKPETGMLIATPIEHGGNEQREPHRQEIQRAFPVSWGWFAQYMGLIQAIHNVPLHQKAYKHSPHTKILEFLVALLGGLPYLQDISRAAHPLGQDQAVAQAWQQPAWADYSGISRTLSTLSVE
jgi:hypothetical protein